MSKSAENFDQFEDVNSSVSAGANLYQQLDMTMFSRDYFKPNSIGAESESKKDPEDRTAKPDAGPDTVAPKDDPWGHFQLRGSDEKLFQAMNPGDDKRLFRDYSNEKPVDTKEKADHPERFKRLELENAIKKADELMPEKDFDRTVGELQHLLLMLESDDRATPKFNTKMTDETSKELGKDGLTLTQRKEIEQKFQETTDKLAAPVKARLKYAEFLADSGGFSEAAKVGAEAQQLAEKFTKPAKITDHITATPTDLEKRVRDLSPARLSLIGNKGNGPREGMSTSLVESNLFLSKLYLGSDSDWNKGVPDKLGDSKMFDPIKAFDAAVKAQDYIKKIPMVCPPNRRQKVFYDASVSDPYLFSTSSGVL